MTVRPFGDFSSHKKIFCTGKWAYLRITLNLLCWSAAYISGGGAECGQSVTEGFPAYVDKMLLLLDNM